ncbi:putative NAD binding Rossmann fold oxidoreductase [Aureobasidium pullulans]|nr:putative NAD binding Rossmann fold oxidoreductase [Aureobasidium pullulans]
MPLLETSAMDERLRFIVIGAGQRGVSYANPVSQMPNAAIYAVAEPVNFRRQHFGKTYIWGRDGKPSAGQEFSDWKQWLAWEIERRELERSGKTVPPGVDGVFVCTLDSMHVEIMLAIAPLNIHVLCEKPLATSLADYRVIGDILSVEHTEPVGWWHFAHSYTRGPWRRATDNKDGSLLTKSCHDIDFLLWLLSQTPDGTDKEISAHLPKTITSTGALNQFKRSRKPNRAGEATNCLTCPYERDCQYSAIKIYDDARLAVGHTHWLNHVVHDIEDTLQLSGVDAARRSLYANLERDYIKGVTPDGEIAKRPWYGRCVYESDNNVCDDQVVTIKWDEDNQSPLDRPGKLATLHMVANTEKECERRGIIYGSHGELSYNGKTIRYFDFVQGQETVIETPDAPEFEQKIKSHGGGDRGLATAFVSAVEAVERKGIEAEEAQRQFVGCTLEDAVRAHAVVFAAEEARRDEKVIQWKTWWETKRLQCEIESQAV